MIGEMSATLGLDLCLRMPNKFSSTSDSIENRRCRKICDTAQPRWRIIDIDQQAPTGARIKRTGIKFIRYKLKKMA